MEHPNLDRKWRNMRFMAYIAIFAGLVITFYVIKEGELSENIIPLLAFWGSIVGAYMGFSSISDNKWNKNEV